MKVVLWLILALLPPAYGEPLENHPKAPLLEESSKLINSGKPWEALKTLSRYQPRAEEVSSYHHVYARALAALKRPLESLEHLRLAYLYADGREEKERTLLERAEVYLGMLNYPEAALCYKTFLRKFPDSPSSEKAHLGLADSLYKIGSFKEALAHYERAGTSYPALYGKANSLQGAGRIKDAHDLYLSLVSRDREFLTSSPDTLFNIGENLRLLGKFNDARVYLGSVTGGPLKYRADNALGLIELEEGKLDGALKFFTSVLQSPERQLRREALLHLAEVCLRLGRNAEAKANLLEIRNNYPYGRDYDTAMVKLSKLYRSESKHQEALTLLKELTFRHPADRKALDEVESIILEAKDTNNEDLLKLWRSFGRPLLDPSRSESLVKVAKGLRSSGRPFVDLCTWILRHGSPEAKAQCQLGLADFYVDRQDGAAASKYIDGVNAKSGGDDALRIQIRAAHLKGEYQKAFSLIQSIGELKQEDLFLMSDIVERSGSSPAIIAFYERALNRVGGPPRVYLKFADLLHKAGKRSDSLEYYKTAVAVQEASKTTGAGDLEWGLYRIATLSEGKESMDALKKIKKGSEVFGRYADAALKEAALAENMGRAF